MANRSPRFGIVQLRSEQGPPYFWDTMSMVTFWSWDGPKTHVGTVPLSPIPASLTHNELLKEAAANNEAIRRHSARIYLSLRGYAMATRMSENKRAEAIQRGWWAYLKRKGHDNRPFRKAMHNEAKEILSHEKFSEAGYVPRELRPWVQAQRIRIGFARRESRVHSVPCGGGGVAHARK